MQLKMKSKIITFKGKQLTNVVLRSTKILSDIVGGTLGPGGNPVLIERPGLPPLVSKDGVTCAESVSLMNATEHVIVEAAKEVCQKTNKEAGDGTTTAIVLAHAIIEEGTEFLQNNPTKSPQELCRELDLIVADVADVLKTSARKIGTEADLKNVAMISSNSDEDVASAVVEAIGMVGDDGTIITEEGGGRFTRVELREGFPINKGLSALGAVQEIFINNAADQECVFDMPYVLLYDGDINIPQDFGIFLSSAFEQMKAKKDIRPVVIVAHKFSPQVVKLIAINVQANTGAMCLLETMATAQPNSKHHLLHDLAAFTNAKVLDPINNTFQQATVDDFGCCEKTKIGRYQAIFLGMDDEARVTERIMALKTQMGNAESDFDAELIKERISQLSGGIATIYVGGSSDLEMREKKHRIEDAINAVRSAISMGVVPGGGAALLALSSTLRNNPKYPPSAEILASALAVPFARIMENSGATLEAVGKAAEETVKSVAGSMPTMIYDSLHHKMVNPYEAGIIDPAKVVVTELVNAFSVAKLLMTIGGTVVLPRDLEEERQGELQAQALANQMAQL